MTDLAREAATFIEGHPDFELAVSPDANIVCFRLRTRNDAQHLELRKILLASGESYITTTAFAGRRWLRFTFMNPASIIEDVERTLDLLIQAATELRDVSAA